MTPEKVLEDKPLAYYLFNEAPGAATIADHSGNGNHGTLSPTGITLGVQGLEGDTAALFNGGRMLIPNNTALNPSNITLEALIIWSGDNGFQQRIIEKSRWIGGEESQYSLSVLPDGKVMVEIQVAAVGSSLVSSSAVKPGQPRHLAATYDGGLMRIYLDGALDIEQAPTLGGVIPSTNATNLSIGNQVDRDRPFNGIIDEVALYDKSLPTERIKAHAIRAASGDDMQPGEVLNPGQSISSANGQYTLVYQGDGNLVLYRNRDRKPLWASDTDGKPAGVCVMQGDGNLVIYDPNSQPVWSSDTWHDPGSKLVMQDDGNVVIYRTNGTALWATNTVQPLFPSGPAASGDDMQPGEVLNPGQSISSANGQYTFVYQDDGNLVVYQNKDGKPLWASRTNGKPTGICIMQGDGNFVMYGPDGEYIWDTTTHGHPGASLTVQDDGTVVIHDTDSSAIWLSDTLVFRKTAIPDLDQECWVEVKLRRDGEIRFRGHIHNGGIETFAFHLGASARSDTFAIGMAHEGRVGGLFWPRDYDWDQVFSNPMAGLAFTRLLGASLDVKAETRGDITGPFGDIAKFLIGWVIGGIILTPALVQIIFVGVAAASLAATGGFAAGARLIGGTLWLLGPNGTMVALISEGVAALGSQEREISQGEYDFANEEVFKGTLPPRERIILTDTIGGGGRPFVFPRFDGKITVNIGSFMYANPMNKKGLFIHELTHTWQLHNTLSEASFIAQAAVCALAGDPYFIPNPLPPFAELNMEQQGALVETWFNLPLDRKAGHPYYRYIEENIRTGNG